MLKDHVEVYYNLYGTYGALRGLTEHLGTDGTLGDWRSTEAIDGALGRLTEHWGDWRSMSTGVIDGAPGDW